jgi:restriction system protein
MSVQLPKVEDFYVPTLKALRDLGGSASIDEIDDRVSELEALTREQLDLVYPTSGASMANDRISWARTYLKIAGLVGSGGRGIWVLTDEGRQALDTLDDQSLRRFVIDAGNAHNAELSARKRAQRVEKTDKPGEVGGGDSTEAESADWTDALLEKMKSMHPAAFERLAQRVLRESGFVKVEVTGKSGDGGIDGVGVLRMKLISFQVLFQCKRYAGSVGAGTVRDFRGAMQGRADKGLIVTTGTFTPDARREATRDGAPAIDLIDGEALCQLLFDLRLGVEVKERIVHDVRVIHQFFDEL